MHPTMSAPNDRILPANIPDITIIAIGSYVRVRWYVNMLDKDLT